MVTADSKMRTLTAAGLLGLVVLGAPLAGCRGERSDKPPRQFLPDMDDSPKFKPQTQTDFFEDGRAMRPRVSGTVAFGSFSAMSDDLATDKPEVGQFLDRSRADLLRDDTAYYQGKDASGAYVARIPSSVQVTTQLIEAGRKQFNISCAACHGYDGAGDQSGTVGRQWAYTVPGFYDPKYAFGATEPGPGGSAVAAKTGLDGYLFDVVRNGVWDAAGVNKMPGYGYAMSEEVSWGIVAYIRTLQATRQGTVDEVPGERKAELERIRSAAVQQQKAEAAKAAGGPAAGTPAATPAPSKEGNK
jgi:mono/diheme cytochrome c family protein